jgi:hypothetical protein
MRAVLRPYFDDVPTIVRRRAPKNQIHLELYYNGRRVHATTGGSDTVDLIQMHPGWDTVKIELRDARG